MNPLRIGACLVGDGYRAIGIAAPLLSVSFTLSKVFEVTIEAIQTLSHAWTFVPLLGWLAIAYIRRLQAHDALQATLDEVAQERDFAYVNMNLGVFQKTAIGPYYVNRLELVFQNLGKKILRYDIKELEVEIAGVKATIGTPVNQGGIIHAGQPMQYGMDIVANNAPLQTFPVYIEFLVAAEYDNHLRSESARHEGGFDTSTRASNRSNALM